MVDIVFKHRGKNDGLEGDILVTTTYISFVPSSKEPITIVWANISDIKFSKLTSDNVFIGLVSTLYSKIKTFQLIGPSIEQNKIEQSRLKTIIQEIRSNSSINNNVSNSNSSSNSCSSSSSNNNNNAPSITTSYR
jgi:hypothetical protein